MNSQPSPASVGPGSEKIELIFLGTGTSSSLPHVDCLTAGPNGKQCRTCLSTLKPEGKHNIRRNTSAVLRITGKDSTPKTIVIDVGKNFQAAAVEWFPKYGLRQIDGVLITHAHADAMNGLDDLRGWTLNRTIQPHIDLYVSQTTFIEVQRAFPYLVSKEFASGGGDVPEFKWHIITDKVPFHIEDTGIEITPFSVHHGRYFSTLPPPGYLPTPATTSPSTPDASAISLPIPGSKLTSSGTEKIHPYLCFAFKIQNSILYMSDVSHIPEDAWTVIDEARSSSPSSKQIPICVLDCLRQNPHTSHFGLAQSVAAARKIGAQRTYLIGFGHEASHDEYVTIGKWIDGTERKPEEEMTIVEKSGVELIEEGESIWARPSHDGLRVVLHTDGETVHIRDDTYDVPVS